MSPINAIIMGLCKSFTTAGRTSRAEFWWLWCFHFVVPFLLIFILYPSLNNLSINKFAIPTAARVLAYLGIIIYVGTLPSAFSAVIRRCHDMGQTGRWQGLLYALLIIAVVITFLSMPHGPSFELTSALFQDELASENPTTLIVMSPLILITGFFDFIFFIIITVTILITIGIFLLIMLIPLGLSLGGPSQPGSNTYGPNPHEVTS